MHRKAEEAADRSAIGDDDSTVERRADPAAKPLTCGFAFRSSSHANRITTPRNHDRSIVEGDLSDRYRSVTSAHVGDAYRAVYRRSTLSQCPPLTGPGVARLPAVPEREVQSATVAPWSANGAGLACPTGSTTPPGRG